MEKTVEHLVWPVFRGPKITPNHLFYAAVAALPLLALITQTPASWWVQSGFETYPGTFARIATDSYPLCRPWRDPVPDAHREAGVHVASRYGALEGGMQSNLAVLLPKDAVVTAVYCGAAPIAAAPLGDCSVIKCPIPAHIQVEDSLFTRGRGLEFSVRAPKDVRTDIGFWIFWKSKSA